MKASDGYREVHGVKMVKNKYKEQKIHLISGTVQKLATSGNTFYHRALLPGWRPETSTSNRRVYLEEHRVHRDFSYLCELCVLCGKKIMHCYPDLNGAKTSTANGIKNGKYLL
jgi:hypothetical protein